MMTMHDPYSWMGAPNDHAVPPTIAAYTPTTGMTVALEDCSGEPCPGFLFLTSGPSRPRAQATQSPIPVGRRMVRSGPSRPRAQAAHEVIRGAVASLWESPPYACHTRGLGAGHENQAAGGRRGNGIREQRRAPIWYETRSASEYWCVSQSSHAEILL